MGRSTSQAEPVPRTSGKFSLFRIAKLFSAARTLTHGFAFSKVDTITQSQRDEGELRRDATRPRDRTPSYGGCQARECRLEIISDEARLAEGMGLKLCTGWIPQASILRATW